MADAHTPDDEHGHRSSGGGTATVQKPRTAPPKRKRLPLWRVLLHNDDVNYLEDVVDACGAHADLTAYQMRLHGHWRDRAAFAGRLLANLNYQDVGEDDRSTAFYYVKRSSRILRKNGWRITAQMIAGLATALPGRHRPD